MEKGMATHSSIFASRIPWTLCDCMDSNLPGSSVHGIFQARVLEGVAISFSRGSSQPRDWTQVSCIAGRCFTIWATKKALWYPTAFQYIGYYICTTKTKHFPFKPSDSCLFVMKNKNLFSSKFLCKTKCILYICVCHRTVMILDMFLCITISLFAQWRWCRSLTSSLGCCNHQEDHLCACF